MPVTARIRTPVKVPRAKGTRGGAQTRERILEEATKLIAERGYRSTTMKVVAECVGVTEPAVYRHFNGKEQLLVAVFSEAVARILSPIARDRSGSAIDGIARQISLLMSPEQTTLRRLIAEMYAAASVEPEVALLAREFVANASKQLIEELRRAVAEGDASPELSLPFARAAIHIFMAGLAHHDTLAGDLIGNEAWSAFMKRALARLLSD